MTDAAPTTPAGPEPIAGAIADKARVAVQGEGVQAQIYKAISVQRPVVLEYLRSLRREKPGATAAEVLKELDRRYVATVTVSSAGVGASAAIPGVGIPVALGLGVADLLFFYETSALYVLAVAEVHGIAVDDAARAQPLVFGMLLGEKSQSQVSTLVMGALGGSNVTAARSAAGTVAGRSLPSGWGEVLTQQLPDSALAPLLVHLSRDAALKAGAKVSAGTLGKAVPFGIGAVIGGVGSFTFGRDVVKAAHLAFPNPPEGFPEVLAEFAKPVREPAEPSRAVVALQSAAQSAAGFGEDVWGTVTRSTEVFRSVDLDGDGIPDEARALTAVKHAGTAIKGAAAGALGAVRRRTPTPATSPEAVTETLEP